MLHTYQDMGVAVEAAILRQRSRNLQRIIEAYECQDERAFDMLPDCQKDWIQQRLAEGKQK